VSSLTNIPERDTPTFFVVEFVADTGLVANWVIDTV